MGLFRPRKTRSLSTAPLPDWDDTRWRSHLRSNALGTDHHCNIYLEMINTDRKEAARLFKNEDDAGARMYAESSLRNKRIVAALAALSPLCNALFQRAEPLAGYTSLVQIPEPARSGIVTIIFSAGRLQLSYLTDTVSFLREQFGHIHIDGIQGADGELSELVNATVRDALSPTPPEPNEVDAELASAVKEYFGISVSPAASRRGLVKNTNAPSNRSLQQASTHSGSGGVALSVHSSELGAPQSPQFSAASSQQQQQQLLLLQQQQQQQLHQQAMQLPPSDMDDMRRRHGEQQRQVHTRSAVNTFPEREQEHEYERDHGHEDEDDDEGDEDDEDEGEDGRGSGPKGKQEEQRDMSESPTAAFGQRSYAAASSRTATQQQLVSASAPALALDDSDQILVRRYYDLRSAMAV